MIVPVILPPRLPDTATAGGGRVRVLSAMLARRRKGAAGRMFSESGSSVARSSVTSAVASAAQRQTTLLTN